VRRKDHRFCSAKGRLAGFQQKQEKERRERDAKVRLLLQEALNLLSANEKDSCISLLSVKEEHD